MYCRIAGRGPSWKIGCGSRALRCISNTTDIPTGNRECYSVRTGAPFRGRKWIARSASRNSTAAFLRGRAKAGHRLRFPEHRSSGPVSLRSCIPRNARAYNIRHNPSANCKRAVSGYLSAFGKGGFSAKDCGELDLKRFGGCGRIPLPPSDCGIGISPEQMQRRLGESQEEYIARITALIAATTEAILNQIAENNRKRQIKPKQQFKMKF